MLPSEHLETAVDLITVGADLAFLDPAQIKEGKAVEFLATCTADMRHILEDLPQPPPQDAFWRCRKFENFKWHANCA